MGAVTGLSPRKMSLLVARCSQRYAQAVPDAGSRRDLPTIEAESRPFWDGAREGQLLLAHCESCGRDHHYPRALCPFCWSTQLTWRPATGRGTLYTYSAVHVNDLPPFAERLPYVAAVVDLEEGPRLMTNLVDCDLDDIRVGMAVEVTYRELTPEVTVPVFRPAS